MRVGAAHESVGPPPLVERLRSVHLKMVGALRRYVGDRARGRPASVPPGIGGEVPIASGDETIGRVLLLGKPDEEGLEFLHLAAVACLTEVAVEEAREEVEQNLRGSFLEELRTRPEMDPA